MQKRPVKVITDQGGEFFVQADVESLEYDVSLSDLEIHFKKIEQPLWSIIDALQPIVDAVGPEKVAVEFGITLGAESGQVTALIVQGTAEANLKVTIEWASTKQK